MMTTHGAGRELKLTEGLPADTGGSPRAAYIHVPFCVHRCGYCNFTLVAGRDDLIGQYLTAIERELSWLGQPRPVDTLFFGGGTPTHLPLDALDKLLTTVNRWFPLAKGHEFSVEANPIDVTAEKLALLKQLDVTRVSLGSQSFNADKLRVLERDHDAGTITGAVAAIKQFGMQVSLDLIFGVPGETAAIWQADLAQAITLQPDHVSTYGLTFERGTQFWNRREHGELTAIDEDLERGMYETAIDRLTAAGFEHYEVSNFARPGRRCRHNENYWAGGEYYAAGPGAARYVAGYRETNHRSTTTYLQRVLAGQSPVAERETLPPDERARELLVFALRRIEGVNREWFFDRSGCQLDELTGDVTAEYCRLGLLNDDGHTIKLTRAGLLVSDAMWPKLLAKVH